jgi:hypothetical protein
LKHEETKLQQEGALLDQLEKMKIRTFVNRAIHQILLTFLKKLEIRAYYQTGLTGLLINFR